MDPERWGRITPTAARIPLTAPSTLTRNARSQSSVARLWMRPFGERTPALLTRTSRRPKRSTARATTASTWVGSVTSAVRVSVALGPLADADDRLGERFRRDVAQDQTRCRGRRPAAATARSRARRRRR